MQLLELTVSDKYYSFRVMSIMLLQNMLSLDPGSCHQELSFVMMDEMLTFRHHFLKKDVLSLEISVYNCRLEPLQVFSLSRLVIESTCLLTKIFTKLQCPFSTLKLFRSFFGVGGRKGCCLFSLWFFVLCIVVFFPAPLGFCDFQSGFL